MLSGNRVSDKGAQCLGNPYPGHPLLTDVGQFLLGISGKGGGALSLEEVILDNNPISSIGIAALLDSLSLDSLLTTAEVLPPPPPLKLLSFDQCYPNLTVLDSVGRCCVTSLRIHFTESDAMEAVQSLHLGEVLARLHESIRNNAYLNQLYLGHLPALLETEVSLFEDRTSAGYRELKLAHDHFLAIADLVKVPIDVTEFAEKDLRTPRHRETASQNAISFEALQSQQKEYELLRHQHKVGYLYLLLSTWK